MSEKGRYVELIRLHILVNCMELRWRQPCSDPVAPCKYKQVSCNCKTVRVKEVLHLFRCYTHTHPLVAGFDFWKTIAANVDKIRHIKLIRS